MIILETQTPAEKKSAQIRGARAARMALWEGMYRNRRPGETVNVLEGEPLRKLLLRMEEKRHVKAPVQASRHTRTRLMNFMDA